MKKLYKINILIALCFVSSVVCLFAYGSGISGQTEAGCTCHSSSSSSNTKISLSASNGFVVDPGSTNGFTINVETLSGKIKSGVNIAVKSAASGGTNAGTLSSGNDMKSSSGELVHANSGKDFSSGKTSFSFDWKAPSTPGEYYIKAAANAVNDNGGNGGDEWNKISSTKVTVKGLELTSLKGGQEFCAGTTANITWNGFGIDNVKIEYSVNGGTSYDNVIIQSTPGSAKSYTWNIPSDLKSSTIRVRISDVANSNIKDQSGSNIKVSGPASITTHPTNQNACTGENISFSVVASGVNLTYQWYKGTEKLSGKTTASLSISNAKLADEGDYKCEVSSECGNPVTSNVASLALTQAPDISEKSADPTICEGENTTLSVVATGKDITYQWYKENDIIPNATNATFQISKAKSSDAGRYKVKVSSPTCGDKTSAYINVNILKPAAIVSNIKETSICENSTLSLSIQATGSSLQYEWYFNNEKILNKLSPDLVIENFSEANVGTYKCKVYNSCNSVFSSEVLISLSKKPVIASQSDDKEAIVGSNVTLNIEAVGDSLEYQWYKNQSILANQINNELVLSNVLLLDSGKYHCKVSNSCGEVDSKEIILSIKKPGSGGVLALSQSSIEFGDVETNSTKDLTIPDFFKNIGNDSLVISNIKLALENSAFEIKSKTKLILQNNSSDVLLLKFAPNEPKNYFDTLLVEQENKETIKVPVSGVGIKTNVKAQITSSPAELLFGSINIGKSKTIELKLINNSENISATISNISLQSDDFNYVINPKNPISQGFDKEFLLDILFEPKTELEANAVINFTFLNADPVSVNLKGSGIITSVERYFESIEIFPNPSSDNVKIRFISKESQEYNISIVDANGNNIYEFGNRLINKGQNILEWNISKLNNSQTSSGAYFLLLSNKNSKIIEKIIIQ